jgi:tryptophan-rich sensory protein
MRTIPTTWKYAVAIGITLLVGLLSGLATKDAIATWYVTLNKPSFNPPNAVFGPVWTLLYLLMGIAMGRVWCRLDPNSAKGPWAAYSVQLALNGLWSLIFFSMHLVGVALVDILALLVAIILCIRAFHRVDRIAAWLMVPYLLWVCFATALNAAIVLLN